MARKARLNGKQRAFADEYIINGYNAYRAAIKAGYSESYARDHSHNLSENVGIKAYIDEKVKAALNARTIKVDEALALVSDIAKGKENSDGKAPSDNTRLKALDMILRANGQYTDKVEVTGDIDVAGILKQAKARADKAKRSIE